MLLKLRERGSRAKQNQIRDATPDLGIIDSDNEHDDGDDHPEQSKGHGQLAADANLNLECITLKKVFEAAVHLVSTSQVHSSSEKILALFIKAYKLLVKIARSQLTQGHKHLPNLFVVLYSFVANEVHGKIQDYFTAVD